jgi:hypothetical protein
MINVNEYLWPEQFRPPWLVYPEELLSLVRSETVAFVPWHLIKVEIEMRLRHAARLKSRLGRELIPFAYRQDREDLACFEKGRGQAVIIIHDNTDPGYEDEGSYPSFAAWLQAVRAEAAEWESLDERD